MAFAKICFSTCAAPFLRDALLAVSCCKPLFSEVAPLSTSLLPDLRLLVPLANSSAPALSSLLPCSSLSDACPSFLSEFSSFAAFPFTLPRFPSKSFAIPDIAAVYVPSISNFSVYAFITTLLGISNLERLIPRFSFISGKAMPITTVLLPSSIALPFDTVISLKLSSLRTSPLATVYGCLISFPFTISVWFMV